MIKEEKLWYLKNLGLITYEPEMRLEDIVSKSVLSRVIDKWFS